MLIRFPLAGVLALYLGLVPGGGLSGADGSSSAVSKGEFARSPYLQFASPNLMHVLWRTWGPITPVVRFGTELTSYKFIPSWLYWFSYNYFCYIL